MNANHLARPTTRVTNSDPTAYALRRLRTLTVVAPALLGIVTAAAAEALGLPHVASLAGGVGAFLVLAVAGGIAAGRAPASGEPAADNDWASSAQLGPDPGQVIARRTGART
jgi:hypothetical protein